MTSKELVKYWIESSEKEFYERCTKEYTEQQLRNIKEIRLWLKEKLV